MLELLRWGTRYLADPARADEPAHDDWMVLPLRWLVGRRPVEGERRWRFEIGDDVPVSVHVVGTSVDLTHDDAELDLTVRAPDRARLAVVLSGTVEPPGELELDGDETAFVALLQQS